MTKIEVPLAVEDLISYKLNNKRKLARLIIQEKYLRNGKHVPCFYGVIETRVKV